MGQKVNPIGFRLAVTKDWRSKWYSSKKEFAENLLSDMKIRKYLKDKLQGAAVSKIVIERAWNSVRVTLFTARPGLVIGKKGQEIERMNADLSALSHGRQVKIDIFEIKSPDLDAQLIAENVALQLERRIAFRRAMKRAVQTAMELGADGIRIRSAGRLGGADIARAEQYRQGKVPLQTLRTNIDYGFAEANTVYGIIGVKCWVTRNEANEEANAGKQRDRGPRRDRRDGDSRGGRGGPGGGRGGRGRGDVVEATEVPAAPEAAAAEAAPAAV